MATPDTKYLFYEAVEQTDAERDEYLERTCGDDPERRGRIDALLKAHRSAEDFMSQPAAEHLSISGPAIELEADFKPGDQIGQFRLIRLLGEGGFGSVFLAEQETPVVRPVAIKVLKLGMDTVQVIARFEAERQALALMDHPCIAKVLDAGSTENGRPYFVMECIEGKLITEYCDHHRVSIEERLEIFEQVCQAVQHAHQKGVIHRDIKPGNVMVSVVDGRPVPKVIDFGIAKALGSKLTERTFVTQDRHLVGTPQYMAPEQASLSGIDVDTRTDVYSLGVLLYELLTGTLPFEQAKIKSAALSELERIIREEIPRKPSVAIGGNSVDRGRVAAMRSTDRARLQRELAGDLDWIVMRALEKDRTRRYATCYALASDIRRHLRHEPVSAGPPSTRYRMAKLWQRRRTAVTAIGLAVIAMFIAIGGTTTFGIIALRAADDAIKARNESRELQGIAETQSYVANIFAAQGALLANDSETARLRLEATPEGLRNWEWDYFNQRLDNSEFVYNPAQGKSNFVAMSPDGQHFATGWPDKSLRIASITDGQELRVLEEHAGQVWHALFSPDGSRLYAGDDAGDVLVWDMQSGELLHRWSGHRKRVSRILLTADGTKLFSCSWDGTTREWDTRTNTTRVVLDINGVPLDDMRITSDGSRAAVTSWDQQLYMVDLVKAEVLAHPYCAFETTPMASPRRWGDGGFRALELSADEKHFLVATRDGRVTAWNVSDGTLANEPDHFDNFAVDFTCSPDGTYTAAGRNDGVITIWRNPGFEPHLELRGHINDIRQISFTSDSQHFVSTSWDNTIRVWDPATGLELATMRGHSDGVYGATFTPDGDQFVTTSEDNEMRVWEFKPEKFGVIDIFDAHVLSVRFTSNPDVILTGPRTGAAHVQNIRTGEILFTLGVDGEGAAEVAVSADGTMFAIGNHDNGVTLWDAKTGKMLRRLFGHTSQVWEIAFSHDGKWVASGSRDGTAIIWDTRTGNRVRTIAPGHGEVRALAFTRDDKRIALGSKIGAVQVFNTRTGDLIHERVDPSIGQVYSVAISPDGKTLAYGTGDRTLRLIDIDTFEDPMELRGHGEPVDDIAWMPDGSRLVTGSPDTTVRLWDPILGENVAVLTDHTGLVRSIAVSPDGKTIISGAEDNTVRAWRVSNSNDDADGVTP